MHKNSNLESKSNAFKLSTQVQNSLHEKGLSYLFNFQDYLYFKKQCKKAFNKVEAITGLFIAYHEPTKSDFNDYVF